LSETLGNKPNLSWRTKLEGKIALEEHFSVDETIDGSLGVFPESLWPEIKSRLTDAEGQRLRLMDQHGIQTMILSLNAPAIQGIPNPSDALDLSQKTNDFLAEQVAKHPSRFRGFAALPMQDPDLASKELERCIEELNFSGCLVNGFSQVTELDSAVYYDLPQYRSFWSTVEKLQTPFYLHPRNPIPSMAQIYDGHPWLLGPTWAFGQETAVHALRLICSGLFDEFPALTIILGHMGEGIPANLWRIDNRVKWANQPPRYPAKKKVSDYFLNNFYITTSGVFRTQSLINAILEIGADKILFSVDWPFENIDHGSEWFDNAGISEPDRIKIGKTNAEMLFSIQT
jgi:2,3-dihydroxybenzoate decarboxylase